MVALCHQDTNVAITSRQSRPLVGSEDLVVKGWSANGPRMVQGWPKNGPRMVQEWPEWIGCYVLQLVEMFIWHAILFNHLQQSQTSPDSVIISNSHILVWSDCIGMSCKWVRFHILCYTSPLDVSGLLLPSFLSGSSISFYNMKHEPLNN